jgi:hypothetical protein
VPRDSVACSYKNVPVVYFYIQDLCTLIYTSVDDPSILASIPSLIWQMRTVELGEPCDFELCGSTGRPFIENRHAKKERGIECDVILLWPLSVQWGKHSSCG